MNIESFGAFRNSCDVVLQIYEEMRAFFWATARPENTTTHGPCTTLRSNTCCHDLISQESILCIGETQSAMALRGVPEVAFNLY